MNVIKCVTSYVSISLYKDCGDFYEFIIVKHADILKYEMPPLFSSHHFHLYLCILIIGSWLETSKMKIFIWNRQKIILIELKPVLPKMMLNLCFYIIKSTSYQGFFLIRRIRSILTERRCENTYTGQSGNQPVVWS